MAIHPYWINSTVFIYDRNEEKITNNFNKDKHQILGTGIATNFNGLNILITAKHIVKNHRYLNVAFSLSNKNTEILNIDKILEENGLRWHCFDSDVVDIAVTVMNFPDEINLIGSANWVDFEELQSGSDISIIGYPLGLAFNDNYLGIRKKGNIARLVFEETELPGNLTIPNKTILIDALIDRGNSGSPIIQEGVSIYTNYQNVPAPKTIREGLIGIASGHFTTDYYDRHAGIGIVHSIDYVKDIIDSSSFKSDISKMLDNNLISDELFSQIYHQ